MSGRSGRNIYQRNENWINLAVKAINLLPKKFRSKMLVSCRNTKGRKGIAIRYVLLKSLAKQCGKNVVVKEMVILENVQGLVLGDNVSIHPFCYIEALGGVQLSDNVSIAHSTSILSVNHTWDDATNPIKYNPVERSAVMIENDVWIGCGCRILAGVTVHTRSVVAAGAVVTKDVPSNVLVGGVPSKIIKSI